jgi:uncharacterized MnhB-related membrane protein
MHQVKGRAMHQRRPSAVVVLAIFAATVMIGTGFGALCLGAFYFLNDPPDGAVEAWIGAMLLVLGGIIMRNLHMRGYIS